MSYYGGLKMVICARCCKTEDRKNYLFDSIDNRYYCKNCAQIIRNIITKLRSKKYINNIGNRFVYVLKTNEY